MAAIVKVVKHFISAHPFSTVALFALVFPVLMAFIFASAFHFGKVHDIQILRYQGLFHLTVVAAFPAVFFIYVLKPHGQKFFYTSILLSIVYAPISLWCTLIGYLTIACKVFGMCDVP